MDGFIKQFCAFCALRFLNRRADRLHQRPDLGRSRAPRFERLDGGFHRATFLVAHHHHQRYPQFGDPKLDTAKDGVVDHLPSSADHEQIAEAGAQDLGRIDARIGAAQDRGDRVLRGDLAAGGDEGGEDES